MRLSHFSLGLAIAAGLAGCSPQPPQVYVPQVLNEPDSTRIEFTGDADGFVTSVGQPLALKFEVAGGEPQFTVDKGELATVDKAGTLTPLAAGVVRVTAKVGSTTDKVLVAIVPSAPDFVPLFKKHMVDWKIPATNQVFTDEASWRAYYEGLHGLKLPSELPKVDFATRSVMVVATNSTARHGVPVLTSIVDGEVPIATVGLPGRGGSEVWGVFRIAAYDIPKQAKPVAIRVLEPWGL